MSSLGFVVVEYNQASGRPSLVEPVEVWSRREEAEGAADGCREWTEQSGRRETYGVAEVVLVEGEAGA